MAEKILEVANSSPAMNIDITGALFTLRIQYCDRRRQWCHCSLKDSNYLPFPLPYDIFGEEE